MSIFHNIHDWAVNTWNKFRHKKYDTGSTHQEIDIIDAAEGLAGEIVEAMTGLDLNGDGIVLARSEILSVAEMEGIKWGKRFVGTAGGNFLASMPEDEVRKWLTV